ncbi:MAG: RNase adapter RapZ [Yaniella sp.]|uniref:RNase adapter RapZ n=1 Tax=Yaniella sp. TaxID=2773929 RepID=UPI002649E29F|nr:RNase adapter RapZ [Yaniella sp.]MDN5704502.1 RNase adapter RapZ [Yaniella sp.]MDN5731725.1 RNase adapter RapZ [Yaniella sp.]MDN5815558.1 RNase adapter RapZ [Yaniella sp.]MDN5818148.1 RNase adapter RapZ [Yaniella sp.]MDN5838406.1 RNase adapter RapZ [Yaniella sp.]
MTSELQPVKPDTAEVLIITGMSGAGRTTAAHSLEDLGWYVVDNLPPQLFSTMAQLIGKNPDTPLKLALVVDVRSKEFFQALQEAMNQLRTDGAELRVLFLDAADEVLVRRFETLRRPHPLQGDGSILEGIAAERELMVALRDQAEMMIDTTDLNVHDLTTATTELFTESGPIIIRLNIMSFGFKYGVPQDSNYIADVRFIPNPHWVPELRPFTGQDQEISSYVLERKGVASFIDSYVAMMEPVIEGYRSENKHYATLAFGCTGGKHRSVAIAEEIAKRLATYSGVKAKISHRDMGRE